jgi:hypothetical protein
MPIHFGTDGWRAVISDTFTFNNLRMVAQAIADAANTGSWNNGTPLSYPVDPKKMVVGFRHSIPFGPLCGRCGPGISGQWVIRFTWPRGRSYTSHLFCNPQPGRERRCDDHCLS